MLDGLWSTLARLAFLGMQMSISEQPHPAPQPQHGLSTPTTALLFGLISATSLPIGGAFGIWTHPVDEHLVARLMSFGAGSLLFAVTIELYGETLHEIEHYGEKYGETPDLASEIAEHQDIGNKLFVTYYKMAVCLLSCLLGAYLYMMLNRKLVAWTGGEEHGGDEHGGDTPHIGRKALFQEAHHEHKASHVISLLQAGASKRKAEEAKQAMASGLPAEVEDEKEDSKKAGTAMAILVGVAVDGVAEGILIGFMAAHNNLSIDFIASVFLANFPEAFSTSSMMKELKRPNWKIMTAWTCLMTLTGLMSWITASALTGIDLHGLFAQLVTGMIEGLAAGAMMMMIISVMIPEAFEVEGDVSAMFMIFGFLCSISITVTGGYVDHIGQPRCVVTRQRVEGDGIRGRVDVMDCN